MCGFAGEFLFSSTHQANRSLCLEMAEKLKHRGPDEQGSFLSADGRCAMGFQRLAVIDLADSHQPMTSGDGKITVAFNGEIYNFRQLRKELADAGAVFRTAGDTEVLLHLYQRYGLGMLNRLDGMFAFVLYDGSTGHLMLARDRVGQKPLWYSVLPDRIIFASEAKAFRSHPMVSLELDKESITSYLTNSYINSPRTIWTHIRKLSPGCSMVADGSCHDPERYWQPRVVPVDVHGLEMVDLVREQVSAAVRSHMVSDVPLGALLSGGIDSSIVVAVMSQTAGQTGGVRTFTAGFEDSRFDERRWAKAVADHCGTDHTELRIGDPPADGVDRIVSMYDEPFGDSSALPTWMICQAARQYVTVALTGDGGDEAFAGYDRYRAMRMNESMGSFTYMGVRLAAGLARVFASHDERNILRRFIRFSDGIALPPALQYFQYRRLFDPQDLKRILQADFIANINVEAPREQFCNGFEDGEFEDEVARAQAYDIMTYLPDDLLVKTDVASMASSLELRAPLLDHRVLTMGLSMPVEAKMASGCGKAILRKAFKDQLPGDITRRGKTGFGVPLDAWMRGPMIHPLRDAVVDGRMQKQGILNPDAVAGLINDHMTRKGDHRHRLWALLVLQRWLDRQT